MSPVPRSYLIVCAGTFRCALPLSEVREVTRPLPVTSAAGTLAGVLGATVVRGAALPVVSLKTILGQPGGAESRFVVVRTPDRDCVLAVDSVETIASIDERGFSPLPSLLHGIEAARAIAAADRDLMVTLDLAMVASMLPAADKVPE